MRQLKITKSITNRESASLDKYLQEIGKEELITVEEEVELAQRIKKGDKRKMVKVAIWSPKATRNVTRTGLGRRTGLVLIVRSRAEKHHRGSGEAPRRPYPGISGCC